jgi:hypothetical protein
MLIIIAFLLALCLESLRRKRQEVLVLEYKYRFFALRDELREYAADDPVLAQNWVFQYLDSTLAKTIKTLPLISIWYVLGLWLTHRNDTRIERARKSLDREYLKVKNQELKKAEEKCIEALSQFMLSRHILLVVISASALVLPAAITVAMREIKKRSLELVVESPETSTLEIFAPAAG